MKLNIGCGNEKWEGFVNCDIDESLKPDKVVDLKKSDWGFEEGSAEEVWISHTIEHVEKKYWTNIFYEANRALKTTGLLILTFPEFTKCAEFWKLNYQGRREYWEHTLYGRQETEDDYHVALCDTDEILSYLRDYGFGHFRVTNDGEPQYTCIAAEKVRAAITREDVYNAEVFGSA